MRLTISLLLTFATLFAEPNTPSLPDINAGVRARDLNTAGMEDVMAGRIDAGERKLAEAVRAAPPSDLVEYQIDLALALILKDEYPRAETLLRRARFLAESEGGPDSPKLGVILGELSKAAAGQRKWATAEDYARQSIAAFERQPKVDPLAVAFARMNLAGVFVDSGNATAAEVLLIPVIETERTLIPNSRAHAYGVRRLAEVRMLQRDWPAAQALYKEAAGLYELALGREHWELSPLLRAWAESIRRAKGSKEDARALENRAKALRPA